MKGKFETIGEWFIPVNSSNKISGTIRYIPNSPIELELHGRLNDDPDLSNEDYPIINGITFNGEKITLCYCYITNSKGSLFSGGENGKPISTYRVTFILNGIQITKTEDLKFNVLKSELFNLDEWLGVSGFIRKKPEERKEGDADFTIHYNMPSPIKFKINEELNGVFDFSMQGLGFDRYQKKQSIKQRVILKLESKSEISLKDFLKYFTQFQNFLSLALYENTYPKSVILNNDKYFHKFNDDFTLPTEISLYFSPTSDIVKSKARTGIELLFTYKGIKETFPEIIFNWFKIYDLLEPAINLVIEQLKHRTSFNENNFLNLAQAAETFHARTNKRTKIPKTEYQLMKNEILELVPKKYHAWLKDQFNFGNTLNLQLRLEELCEKYSNEFLNKLIGNRELFVKQIKYSRNYYTHYSSNSRKNALKGSRLFFISEKLKILLICGFLTEIGMEKQDLSKFMEIVKWRLFNHIKN